MVKFAVNLQSAGTETIDSEGSEVLVATIRSEQGTVDQFVLTRSSKGTGFVLAHGQLESEIGHTLPVMQGDIFQTADDLIDHIADLGHFLRKQLLEQLRDYGWFSHDIQRVVVLRWESTQNKSDHQLTSFQSDLKEVCSLLSD